MQRTAIRKSLQDKPIVPTDPVVQEILKRFDGGLNGFFERFVKEMSETLARRLLQNEQVMYELAMLAMRQIPLEKIRGAQGEKGEKGDSIKGDKGEPGKDGRDGKDGKDGRDGKDGQNFFTKEQEASFLEQLAVRVITDMKLDGKAVVDMVNGLEIKPELQIDAKHIKNFPKTQEESLKLYSEKGGIHRGGIKLVWNVQLSGDIDGVNTVFTIPASQPDPKDNKYLVSARGVLKDVDSGDFTISNNNRTITFTTAPPTGSARPRIPLYHGK